MSTQTRRRVVRYTMDTRRVVIHGELDRLLSCYIPREVECCRHIWCFLDEVLFCQGARARARWSPCRMLVGCAYTIP